MKTENEKNFNCKTAAFLTLGCKVNSYETEAMQKIFEDAGYRVVEFTEHSDVYVVNTCTVTNIADRKSRQMLHRARKMNKGAVVVAVGCYVQTAGDVLEQDEAIDIVIGNNKKKDILRILNDYNENRKSRERLAAAEYIADIGAETEYEDLNIESVTEKTRVYIKIQDGCNQFCSYCIIPYARGRVRSRAKEAVLDEVKKLVSKGYKEIVLTGIHLSSYGIDFNKKMEREAEGTVKKTERGTTHHLLELMVLLSRIEGLERIRLGSLEPRIITEEFVQTLSDNKKICPHFHLSLQSGCDETLKRMNRKYSTGEYYEKCQLLRRYFENPAITTDVIVGFPGETEDEFNKTVHFLKKISFAKMHVFKYSVRKGTRAEHMPDQVLEEIKSERSSRLIELEEIMNKEYQELFTGKIENILIEDAVNMNGESYQIGHNERYLRLAVKSDEDLNNQIIRGKVTAFLDKDIMFCEIMD